MHDPRCGLVLLLLSPAREQHLRADCVQLVHTFREGILWNLATSRLRGERAAAYLAVHRAWIRMGMPAAGRSVTRCFNSGTKLGRKLRRTLRRSVARITTASDRAKLIPMQIRGPAPKGRYA